MNVSVQNVCGARTKAGAIRREMESGNTDILILIETHLKAKHISLFNKHIGFGKHQDKVIHDVSAGNDYKGVTVVVGKNVPFIINQGPTRNHKRLTQEQTCSTDMHIW